MADIKLKEKNNMKIKEINKAMIYSQKLKNNIVNAKETVTNNREEESSQTEYGTRQIIDKTKTIAENNVKIFNKVGEKSLQKTIKNVQETKGKITNNIENKKIMNRYYPHKQNKLIVKAIILIIYQI